MSGWRRFLLHMLIVAVVGPTLGIGVYRFIELSPDDHAFLARILSPLKSGLLLFFILPITSSFGLATYCLCWSTLPNRALKKTWLWTSAGGTLGAVYGLMWASYAVHERPIFLSALGTIIGLATGAVLMRLWKE